MIPQVFGSGLYARAMYRFYLHRVRKQTKGQGTARKPLDHVRRDLERHLDAVEQLVRPWASICSTSVPTFAILRCLVS